MFKVKAGAKLLFIGDSITDAERAKPAGEGLFGALGKGYVSQVDALIQSTYPERQIRVVNQGTSGNTVLDLKARWQTDVVKQKPDWLSIMIGINDVWRQFDLPWQKETHVSLKVYSRTLEELVSKTRRQVQGLVLCTPFLIEANPDDPMRVAMDQYGAAVKAVAKKHNAIFVDTQAAFDAFLIHYHPMSIAWDRIHPSPVGHMILSRAILRAL